MKIYIRNLLLVISLIFVSPVFFIENVKAEDKRSNFYSYEWKEDSLVVGNNQIEGTFYIPQNMRCNNFTVSLKIKQSPTLIKELSSISVLINNIRVYTVMIDRIGSNGIITFNIPDYLIYKGGNSIIINGFLKSTRERCEINNDVNWFIVEKTSSFSFNYSRSNSTDISGIFDDTYYSNGLNGEVYITLPNDLIKTNYSQISSISALVGFIHKNKETDVNIKAISYSELNKADKETILIGTVDQIKAFNKTLLNDKQWEIAAKSGYIALRKIEKKNHFIIIVSNDSQLETLCRILQNKSSLAQLNGKDYVLDKNKIVNAKDFSVNSSLKALGYENSTQAGNGEKVFNYYFSIPAKKTLSVNNKITFVYNYSSLVDYNSGYVTAAINGENLISKNFVKGKVQDKLEFSIPEKYFDYAGFNISLKFNLKPDAENCSSRRYEDIWVSIDSINSNLKFGLKDRTQYSLLNSQGLIQDYNGYVDGTITVDSFSNLSIDSICKISSYSGKVSQGVYKLNLIESNNSNNTGGVIISLTTSPIIKSVKDNLIIPVSVNGEFENKDLFVQNTPSLGVIELTLARDKLLIAANDKEQLNITVQKYSEASSFDDAVVLKNGKVIDSFNEAKSPEAPEGNGLGTIKRNTDIILGLAVLLGASISLFILYYKKIKK